MPPNRPALRLLTMPALQGASGLLCTLLMLASSGCKSSYSGPCAGVTCGEHGRCVTDGKTASCDCDPGYEADGLNCVDPCEGVTCSGHGRCEQVDGAAMCACDPGYVNHWPIFCAPEPQPGVCNQEGWCWQNPVPQGNDLFDVWVHARDDVWAVGAAGTMLHWDGLAWTRLDTGTDVALFGVWASATDDVWAVGDMGIILHWNGNDWSSVYSGTAEILRGV